MNPPIVSDSTCLIVFERIGRLDLLPGLFATVAIPPAVDAEFGRRLEWLEVIELGSAHLSDVLNITLGKGEAEAIALSIETNCPLITDDKQARATAERLGIGIYGSMGLLIKAKQAGIIDRIKPIIDEMETNRFRISRALREEVLRLVGE